MNTIIRQTTINSIEVKVQKETSGNTQAYTVYKSGVLQGTYKYKISAWIKYNTIKLSLR